MTAGDLPSVFATVPMAWRALLADWTEDDEVAITAAVRKASANRPIGPPDPFRALRLVVPDDVKVVIIGQDPYPGSGHADGLAFSAPSSGRPSLRRIFDILEADRPGWRRPRSGRLDAWAIQGVLLLNPTLTVEVGRANSHGNCGWQALTSRIVRALINLAAPPQVLLWGSHAQKFWHEVAPSPSHVSVHRTRHPSNDYRRAFMAEGSHFMATAAVVDWWALRD